MPLYEYQCDQCGHRFELIRKFSDPAVETCPKCGGHVQKLISASAFQLKGSGWYITDYARKDSPGAGKSENASKESGNESTGDTSGTSADAKSDSSKESKSEPASESKTDSKKEGKKEGGKAAPAASSSDSSSTSKT